MNKGFALVETLVVVFVAVLILGAVFTVSNVSSWSLQTGTSLSDTQWEARKGINRMLEELYVAGQSTATIDSAGGFITFQVPTINTSTGTIYKEDGTTINWGDGATTDYKIRYLASNEQLNRQVLGASNRFIQWKMKYDEDYVVYISCNTSAGHRYIYYTPSNDSSGGNGEYVHHGLGSDTRDGQWHTITRYLDVDLHDFQPDVDISSVDGFLIRGSGRVDDIQLHSITCEDAEDGDISGWDIYDPTPGGAEIENVDDADRDSRVIRFLGNDTDNGYRLQNSSFASWTRTPTIIISNTVLANDIAGIAFAGYDENGNNDYTQPNTVGIGVTASKASARGNLLQSHLSSQVTLRN